MNSVRLGLQLLIRGGRAGAIRSISLGLGVAVTVAAVLTLLSAPGVATNQAERQGAMVPQTTFVVEETVTTPLWATFDAIGLGDREIRRLVIAPTGAAPFSAPAWMGQIPNEGEVVVSPALRDAIESDPLAAALFPGAIIGEIGEDALVAPNSLAAVVGADAAAFDPIAGATGLGQPDPAGGTVSEGVLRLIIAIIVMFVLAPLSALIATAARLSARTTEQRLASLRLMGLTARRTRVVLAVETATVALAGTMLGSAAWVLLAPMTERVSVGSVQWWGSDVSLSAPTIAAVITAVVAASVVISLVGSNPSLDNPVAVRRNTARNPTMWWRLAVLSLGFAGMATIFFLWESIESRDFTLWYLGASATIAIGLVVAVPLLSHIGAALLDRSSAPSAALAARRLRFEPGAIGRVISALLIVVFAGGFGLALSAILVEIDDLERQVVDVFPQGPTVLSSVGAVDPDLDALRALDGVAAAAAKTYGPGYTGEPILEADCANLTVLSVSTRASDCDDDVPQFLVSELIRNSGASSVDPIRAAAASEALRDRGVVEQPDVDLPLTSDIVQGVRRSQLDTGGTVRVAPDLLKTAEQRTTQVFFAVSEGASPTLVAAAVSAIEPTGSISGLPSIARTRRLQAFALLLNSAVLVGLVVSVAAAAMAASDRAIERSRNAAHLAALGVPGRIQRRTEALTTLLPLALGVLVAGSGAALSNAAFVASRSGFVPFDWAGILTLVGTGLIAAALAAAASAAATTTVADPTRLRTE